ncbi:putative glutathione-S-transferase theta, GST [Annulohypoxylon truncatum]|uniref:putative glutathione-S-transferase theta, GST n=1 Tax=Annulohypoxylon truncatum TaxID=327061 RepID=UPI0020082238|nr:putative glutathione-S-transferase theta, GST [Annulohypoxylon truncatum]KAI1210221.1 putative glutathione-S-transferase theta, GST [Annulohypoxylon truncatum]
MAPPDADLHPVATGLAKKTVDDHSAEQPLKLFAGWFCPFVQRVWITLEEKGIPYQYIEINPYHKGPELLRANPRGLVPTLEVAPGKALYESTVLCEYLEDHYPEYGPRILPPAGKDDYTRAKARIWTDFVTSRVIPAFHRLLQFQTSSAHADGGAARLDALRREFRNHLLEFSREADPEGPLFFGPDLSLADIALIPWADRLWVFEEFKGGLGVPDPGKGGEDEEAWGRWRRWVGAATGRESVRRTTSEREYLVPIYRRYADDTAMSELAKATRDGRGVP